jgi:hypothetical protein
MVGMFVMDGAFLAQYMFAAASGCCNAQVNEVHAPLDLQVAGRFKQCVLFFSELDW